MRFIRNWDDVYQNCINEIAWPSVLFIDHAPGERRRVDIVRFAEAAEIIIAHDTEPKADHGYKMRAELAKFRYQVDYETSGAWPTAVSNTIDISRWPICGR